MKAFSKLFLSALGLVYLLAGPALVLADSGNGHNLQPKTILCLEKMCRQAQAASQTGASYAPTFDTAVQLMNHDQASVRRLAAYTLGEIKDAAAVETLVAGLEDPDAHVRRISARALAKIGDRRAVQPLIGILGRDEARHVKITAVNSLGRLGDDRAVLVLADLAQKESGSLKNEAVLVLKKLSPRDKLARLGN